MGDTEDYSSDESSSSDEDEVILGPHSDKDFFKTLSYLKNKDPKIYDSNVRFFNKEPDNTNKQTNKSNKEKSVFVRDYELNNEAYISDEEINPNRSHGELTYAEEQQATKQFFKEQLESDSSSEHDTETSLIKIKVKSEKDKQKEEDDYVQFLKGAKQELGNEEEEKELKPLQEFWNKKELDEKEEFLKDYILNKRYLSSEPTELQLNEDLSEDERELEEQAEFENKYNRRFETEENLQIKRFPRNIEGSLRRKDDSRRRKRIEVAERKKEEKAKKHREVKRKQQEKLNEIQERLEKLKELTGNAELGFKDEEILEDFDPEKHDKRMAEFFNDDYYNKEDEGPPTFNEDDYNWENFNMDCEADTATLTRTQKKKLRKKKGYKDIMDIAKPSFDPEVHNDFKQYFDEYYSLDCEDFIDDMPCKFKYREVVPNDFGLTVEEILMADDSELNKWASLKKICKLRPDHVEKNEVKIYRKKARDEELKKKILCSLYEEENEKQQIEKDSVESNFDSFTNIKKKKKKLKHHPPGSLFDDSLSNDVNDYSANNKHIQNNVENKLFPDANLECEKNVDIKPTETVMKKRKKRVLCSEDFLNGKVEENNVNMDQGDNTISYSENKEMLNSTKEYNLHSEHLPKKKQKVKHEIYNNIPPIISYSNKNTDDTGGKFNGDKFSKFKNKKFRKKNKGNDNFIQRTKRDITELSDNRLKAYGIKPKQFRSKMKFRKRN